MKKILKQKLKFIKYSFVGGICTIVNLVLFCLFVKMEVYYIIANVISYFLSVVLNYLLNKCFVFMKRMGTRKEQTEQFGKFLSIRLFNMVLDNVLFYCAVTLMGGNVYIVRMILTISGLFFSYYFINRFVFIGNGVNE